MTSLIKEILIITLMLFVCHVVPAQSPEIYILQDDTVHFQHNGHDYLEINLKHEPFTIVFSGKELHVCAGLDEQLFNFTQPDTDINADFNSYFFIFKYMAGSETTDYLSIEKDSGMSLNETHGAKAAKDGFYQFKVNSLWNDGRKEPISDFNELYLSLWLDANKDQYIDKEELIWVKASLN